MPDHRSIDRQADQYAAAYGGIRDLCFGPGDHVEVDRITLPPQLRRLMSNELLLFYTGITRSANTILNEQSANTVDRLPQLAGLRALAGEAADGLRSSDIDAVGVAMNKSWEAKRALALRNFETRKSTRRSRTHWLLQRPARK